MGYRSDVAYVIKFDDIETRDNFVTLMLAKNDKWITQALDEWLLGKAQKYADEIFEKLREEYDAYTSEEYFKDLCDINGWRFDKRGILINEE